MIYTPVALFAYNRADKLRVCLNALENNDDATQTELYVFADGAKGAKDAAQVREVREFLQEYSCRSMFKSVIIKEAAGNHGLAASIISGVTEVISRYGQIIVVEDDLVTSSDFLRYMNGALDFYQDKPRYGSVSAYTFPMKVLENYPKDVYMTKKGECWGWGTWADRWNNVDWKVSDYEQYVENIALQQEFEKLQYGLDRMLKRQMNGEIDSWAVRWCYYLFRNDLLTVYPKESRILNSGFDGSGTNCGIGTAGKDIGSGTGRKCHYEELTFDSYLASRAAVAEKPSIWVRIQDFVNSHGRK